MKLLTKFRQADDQGREQVISYLKLRFGIGLIGVMFPFMLFISNIIGGGGLIFEDSISDYYDNNVAGDIFVGILFALGFFLSSYRGESNQESILATIAAFFAIATALLPTTSMLSWVSTSHWVSASLLFFIFIYFAFMFYKKESKVLRKRMYLVCAIVMFLSMVFVFLGWIIGDDYNIRYKTTFIGEAVALIAFGVSWIIKTEVALSDLNPFQK
ncbi:MAG: hypothetical protein HOP11_04665 [Saprospiraceae bacterium]|nr:hypothetical protein [Saprospiraceae bacterium]